jgi:SOS-response transcriptional repressor LexA
LRAAAGRLGEEMESAEEDWVRAPEGLRLGQDLFVAHVVGRSMEPRIPDGSLNLFRLNPVGSRQNKILLIQRFGVLDDTARYTVKRYTSRKVQTGEDEWRHEQIRLEPLNPEFEAWDVEPQDFAVVAEWLRVID